MRKVRHHWHQSLKDLEGGSLKKSNICFFMHYNHQHLHLHVCKKSPSYEYMNLHNNHHLLPVIGNTIFIIAFKSIVYAFNDSPPPVSQKEVWHFVLADFYFEHTSEAASVCGPVLAWYMFLFLFSSLDLDVPGEGGIKTGLLMYSIYFYEGVTIFTNVWILLTSVDSL